MVLQQMQRLASYSTYGKYICISIPIKPSAGCCLESIPALFMQ